MTRPAQLTSIHPSLLPKFFRSRLAVSSCLLAYALALTITGFAQEKIFINDKWPIRGKNGTTLSPPHVEPTNECAKSVYVDSFVPKAEITVFRAGTTLIGGPFKSTFGFADVPLTVVLKASDSITAVQKVNGVTSPASTPMIVGKMPSSLPPPSIDPNIYACGRIVPVHNLVSGVTVEVTDLTTGGVIGNGSTPNLWGSDWDPVVTSSLVDAHKITAKQSACTGAVSHEAPHVAVKLDPSPMNAPTLDTPIVGNDAITAHDLYTGSVLQAFDHATPIGSGLSTAESNWMGIAPPIASTSLISAQQSLCSPSPTSPPQKPTTTLPPPILVGPICPHAQAAIVRDTTIDATLVLLKNGVVSGYGGAAPGDVPLDIAPPAVFAQDDKVQVVEYIGTLVAFSNTVVVGCTSVTTYHNDSKRTGWNPHENTLTPANVNATDFGLVPLAKNPVPLDDQVDAQPLVVANQKIEGEGVHTVVYVVTENNSVYAIDSWSGDTLKQVNLGPPVKTPLGCFNNGPNVGITGTPTIDVRGQTIYVMVYTLSGTTPIYQIHALDLSTLKDKPGSPTTVSASQVLQDGTKFTFNAEYQRQRPALLEANGNVYAGFGSFCDYQAANSRGWVLGWSKSSLAMLSGDELTNRLNPLPPSLSNVNCTWSGNHPCFLSSLWMSGYGVAADAQGSLYFTTGNSASGSYDANLNVSESAVKLAGDLSHVVDTFTPNDESTLDTNDTDYGSGGLLVLPDQPGPVPHLAVASGKDGRLFILNRDSMGGLHTPDLPSFVDISSGSGSPFDSHCHCGQSYFEGSNKVGRVVSSGDVQVRIWTVDTTKSPALQQEASGSLTTWAGGQDGGFFTSISSNGTNANTEIIWALGRPIGSKNTLTLYAFNGTASGSSLPLLWQGMAGSWPNTGGNANLVPTVANGRVYVASYKSLAIFGLRPGKRGGRVLPRTSEHPEELMQEAPPMPKPPGAQYWGTVKSVEGDHVTLALRNGQVLEVDLSNATKNGTTVIPIVGHSVVANGTLNDKGVLEAHTMQRVKGPSTWGPDSPK